MASSNQSIIAESFNCPICFQGVRSAHICPHCSKLFCHICISQWLNNKNTCPNCRQTINLVQLVKCRWADDIVENIDAPNKINRQLSNDSDEFDKCTIHAKENLNLYCLSCKKPICGLCAVLFDCNKKSHKLKHIEEVYLDKYRKFYSNLDKILDVDKIRALQDDLAEQEELLKMTIEGYKFFLKDGPQKMRESLKVLKNSLENQTKRKIAEMRESVEVSIKRLENEKNENIRKMNESVENLITCRQFIASEQIEIYEKSLRDHEELINQQKEIYKKYTEKYGRISESFEISEQGIKNQHKLKEIEDRFNINNDYFSNLFSINKSRKSLIIDLDFDKMYNIFEPYSDEKYVFKIDKFSQKINKIDEIRSPKFNIDGRTWQLILNKNCEFGTYEVYLGVFIELLSDKTGTYEYRIELVKNKDEMAKYNDTRNNFSRKEIIYNFDSQKQISRDLRNFYKLDSLVNDGFIDAKYDTLRLQFQACYLKIQKS